MRRFVGLISILLIMIFSSLASAQSDLRILYSPMVLELAGERGSTVPFEITIMNDAQFSTAHFRAEAAGLQESRDGVYNLRTDDDWEYGASSWIELQETEFSVPPGEFYVLRGVVRIPRQAPGSGYATVVAELIPEPKPADVEASTSYYQRFPTALEIVVGQQQRRSAFISDMRVIPTASTPELASAYGQNGILFLATLENDGDVHVRGQGQLIIRDPQGRRVRSVPLGSGRGVVIPQAALDFGSIIRGLAPGEYEVEARIEYGGHRPAVTRTTIEIGDDLAGVSGSVGGRGMRVDVAPGSIELVLQRQGYRASTVSVTNHDNVDVRFKVFVEELAHDYDGIPMTVEPGVELPYSAAAWAEVRPDEFVLRPGQRRSIIVGFQVPEVEDGGRYARIRIEAEPANMDEVADATNIVTDLDVSAILTLGTDHERSIDVGDLQWEQLPNSPLVRMGLLVRNTGNIHFPVAGRVTLLKFTPASEEVVNDVVIQQDERWDVVEQIPAEVSMGPVLPGEVRFMQAALGTAFEPLTQYQGYIEIAIAGGQPLAYRLDLWMDADGIIHLGTLPEDNVASDGNS